MNLDDLATPALILDYGRLRANTEKMSARATAARVSLRPHMKTAKSVDVAVLATAGHTGAITVSTLAEAAYFHDNGMSDITYAVCLVPSKVRELASIQARGARISALADDAGVARRLGEAAAAAGATVRLLIEIDSGEHRTGVAPDAASLLDIAAAISESPHLELEGVLTHGGHSYWCKSVDEVVHVAEQERAAAIGAAERLRAAGHACKTVSAGSTPTAVHAASFDGLTEIRPGVYVFFDLAQHGRGSCDVDDIAISVLAEVISHRPSHGRLLVDAGGLALSKDTSANERLPGTGYGWVCDPVTMERIGDLHVASADQEHGFVEGTDVPFERLPVGSRVRILPNHACMTAAAYGEYQVVDGGTAVIDAWPRINGWS